jgi:hypothetical protein
MEAPLVQEALMCYAFELEYYRRMEEARKALEQQQRKEQQRKSEVPAKPAEADSPSQEQPVPV